MDEQAREDQAVAAEVARQLARFDRETSFASFMRELAVQTAREHAAVRS